MRKAVLPPWARVLAAGLAVACVDRVADACDVCAIYTATELRESSKGPYVGVAQQFTYFGTLQDDGETVANPFNQRLVSFITQVLLGYNVTDRIGVQLNLPIISRTFQRVEEGRVENGTEAGFGDMALTANVLAYHHVGAEGIFRFTLFGGLELPTGNPDRLGEEVAENDGEAPGAPLGEAVPQHAGEGHADESGIHGHDLALGSGSYDGIVGGSIFWTWRRLFLQAATQYAIRGTGAFDYRYANDLVWGAGPGVYALLTDRYTLGLQAALTGETKGNDEQMGRTLDDTAITALYLTPAISFTWETALGATLAVDVPVLQHNTGLQIVPDVRARGGLTWRF